MPKDTTTTAATSGRLARLLAFHENAAASIRQTIALLATDPTIRKSPQTNGHAVPGPLGDAIAVEAARRKGTGSARPKGPRGGWSAASVAARRGRSAAWLEQFNADTPIAKEDVRDPKRIAGFVRHGYLKRKGPGYVRTSKPFQVDERKGGA